MQFLQMDSSARAAALGGAYTALAQDAHAPRYNPAGLAWLERSQAAFLHNQYLQGINHQYAGVAHRRGWGASFQRLDFGRVDETTVFNPDGTGQATGLTGLAVGAAHGRRLGASAAAGLGIKLVRESVDTLSAQGVAADLGLLLRPDGLRGLTLGAAALNLGPPVRYDQATERLPATFRFGGAYARPWGPLKNLLAVEVAKERGAGPDLHVGAEASYLDALSFRLGYDGRSDAASGISYGLGWRRGRLELDYAVSPLGALGWTHRIGLALSWGA